MFPEHSLFGQAERVDDGANPFLLGRDERAEFLAGLMELKPFQFVERLFPGRRFYSSIDGPHQRVALGLGNFGSGKDAAPVHQLDVDSEFAQGRHGHIGQTLSALDGQCAQAAGFDVGQEFAHPGDSRGNVAAQ